MVAPPRRDVDERDHRSLERAVRPDECRQRRRARRSLLAPNWRLLGAAGYLGFDIAALGATFAATGHPLPLAPLVLGYLIGYLANLIPVPGGFGVLEGGLAGLGGYALLRRRLNDPGATQRVDDPGANRRLGDENANQRLRSPVRGTCFPNSDGQATAHGCVPA